MMNDRVGNTVFCQIICIPIGAICAPLIIYLFVYCYKSQSVVNLQKPLLITHGIVYST